MADFDPFRTVQAVVAIPVRDEAERIADCLLALGRQQGGAPGILLLVNNTGDGTLDVVGDMAGTLPMPVVALTHVFAEADASAGAARRLAMAHADRLAPAGTPLLTTDADGRAAPDWLAANLRHLGLGVDAVFGRAVIDPDEAAQIPPALHRADEQERAFAEALDEIAHWIAPDPDDPWPRHTEHSGASIAVRRDAFRRAGGIPAMAIGEDRAFAAALRRSGARVRHAPDVEVVVSGRILGRAAGGMADTIRRRLVSPDITLDEALEPVDARVRRLRMHRAVRGAFGIGRQTPLRRVETLAGLSDGALSRVFDVHGALDLVDAALPSELVPVGDLPEQMVAARRVLAQLRVLPSVPVPA